MRLVANPGYWDRARGPHLAEVVFCNELPVDQALNLVCTTKGEVDLVTEIPPGHAARVERSEHARVVAVDPVRAVVGIIDRDAGGLPFGADGPVSR